MSFLARPGPLLLSSGLLESGDFSFQGLYLRRRCSFLLGSHLRIEGSGIEGCHEQTLYGCALLFADWTN